MANPNIFFVSMSLLALSACSAPHRTESTTSESTHQTEGGGEVSHQSSETLEVEDDGARTTETTESTQTSTPGH